MKAAVIVFPASNCDRDVAVALEASMGHKPIMVWHRDSDLPEVDLVVVPGGFSYGDYLRLGPGIDLHQQRQRFTDPRHFIGQTSRQLGAVHTVNGIEQLHRLADLIGL